MLSRRFIERLKLSDIPQYKIAIQAGINPCVLSKYVIGAQNPRLGDERLLRVGHILGLRPEEVFNCSEGDFQKRIDVATSQCELVSIRKEIENHIGNLSGKIRPEHKRLSLLLDEIENRLQKI